MKLWPVTAAGSKQHLASVSKSVLESFTIRRALLHTLTTALPRNSKSNQMAWQSVHIARQRLAELCGHLWPWHTEGNDSSMIHGCTCIKQALELHAACGKQVRWFQISDMEKKGSSAALAIDKDDKHLSSARACRMHQSWQSRSSCSD